MAGYSERGSIDHGSCSKDIRKTSSSRWRIGQERSHSSTDSDGVAAGYAGHPHPTTISPPADIQTLQMTATNQDDMPLH